RRLASPPGERSTAAVVSWGPDRFRPSVIRPGIIILNEPRGSGGVKDLCERCGSPFQAGQGRGGLTSAPFSVRLRWKEELEPNSDCWAAAPLRAVTCSDRIAPGRRGERH